MACDICQDSADPIVHEAHERMFGWNDRFEYLECGGCGCLRIAAVPETLGKYYPKEYYSFQPEVAGNALLRYLLRRRDRYAFRGKGILGRWLNAVAGNPSLESIKPLALKPQTPILDVGCGAGALLRSLFHLGFEQVEGLDPHNEDDLTTPEGIRIRKSDLGEVDGRWDLIMLHHVFEHVEDQRRVLEQAQHRLSDGGTCLIRTPVAGSYAWSRYGVHWVQLDAPRHLCLHTVDSLKRLAEQTGFTVENVLFDSTSFQFWGSELYRRDISLRAAQGSTFFKIFSIRELRAFGQQAKELNADKNGDQAVFYLKKGASA